MGEKTHVAVAKPPEKAPAVTRKFPPATLQKLPDLKSLAQPAAAVPRAQAVLQLQQTQGNFYVQKALAEYRKSKGDPEAAAAHVVPPGNSMESWKAGLHTATRSLHGDKPDAASKVARLQQAGAAKVGQQEETTQRLPHQGKAAISRPPKAPTDAPLIPPKVDPVPQATVVVEAASNKALAAQVVPPMEESPMHHVPQIGGPHPAPPAKPEDGAKAVDDPAKQPAQDTGDKDPRKQQADKVNKAAEKEQQGPIHKGQGGEIVIEPHPPAKEEPEVPKAFKGGIAAALARLMVDPKGEAQSILKEVRGSAYGGALQEHFPHIGDRWLDELTTSLNSELDGIRAQAGISEQEIKGAVDKRRLEIQKEKEAAQGQITTSGDEEKKKLAKVGTDALSVIAGTREQIDQATEEKLEQVKGENDPEVVRLKRERLIHETHQKVAKQVVHYEEAGKTRHDEMTQVVNLQRMAYREVIKLDEQDINTLAGSPEAAMAYQWVFAKASSRNWRDGQLRMLEQLLVDKAKETDSLVHALTSAVHDAGQQAAELIRLWADDKLKEERGFWQSFLQMFEDWSQQAQAESEAWETSRNKATRDAMVGDMNFLGGVVMTAGDELSEESKKSIKKLSAEERAIVMSYYGVDIDGKPVVGAKDPKNPLAAISAGLRARILQQRGPKIVERFEEDLKGIDAVDWPLLDALGKAQNPGFSAAHVCSEVHEALHGGLTGWNDEPRVFAALAGLTKVQALAARKLYSLDPDQGGYGKDLDADIHSELGGTFGQHHAERDRAEALLAGDQAAADAATLREAMKGGITKWGTDEKAIMETLRGKSAAERDKIKQAYFDKYDAVLEADIQDELTGTFEDDHDYDRAKALLAGDTSKADAIAIDQAMYGASENKKGTEDINEAAYRMYSGLGTDRKAIEGVYEQVRKDTERELQQRRRDAADRHEFMAPLTTAELEAEVKSRYEQIEASYNVTYKGKWGEGEESGLRKAYKDELSGGELTLVNAIADNDLVKADAARIQVEKESYLYADDDIINGVLRHQYERALEELKRDKGPALEEELEKRRAAAAASHHPWDVYRLKQEELKIQRQLEEEAKLKGKSYMEQLNDSYHTEFGAKSGQTLSDVIENNMSGYERQAARKLVSQGGWLTPAQEIHFATEGLGTKEEAFSKALEGRTKEEIAAIRKEWETMHPGESLEQRIDSETSGKLNFELTEKLNGEPMSMEEEKTHMDRLVQHEREHGSILAGDEQRRLEFRYREMNEKYAAANDPSLSDEQKAQKIAEFQRFSGYTNVSVQEHKESMQSITDGLVNAVTTAIAVVLAAAAIFFSGGTATPAVIAALGTWWGAATAALVTAGIGIGIRKAMLGSDYGAEDMGIDMVLGGVDAVAAAATVGLSKFVMASPAERLAESLTANVAKAGRQQAFNQTLARLLENNPELGRRGVLATMTQSKSMATRMFGHGVSGVIFGAAGSIPSGAARSILDSKTWEGGGAWEKILSGTTGAMKTGAAGGALFGVLGGIHNPNAAARAPGIGETPTRPISEHDALPPGGQHTSETLREGLPPDLQKKIPITVDPELNSNTVRVHYEVDENGVFKDIHIRTGPNATPRDIELHVRTIRTMQKYAGLQGRVRVLIAKARARLAGRAVPSARFVEAKLEVDKLPKIISEKMALLAEPDLDVRVRAELEAKVEHLQEQLNEHQGIIEGTVPEGDARGYVAAEGHPTEGVVGATQEEPVVVPDASRVVEIREQKADLEITAADHDRAAGYKQDDIDKATDRIDTLKERREQLKEQPQRRPAEEQEIERIGRLIAREETKIVDFTAQMHREEFAAGEVRARIAKIDSELALYKNARPWRTLDLSVMTKEANSPKGLYGELETNARMQSEGFECLGKTRDPSHIITPADFAEAVTQYEGRTGIDGIYKRTGSNGEVEYWCGEMKTTGVGEAPGPAGKGALKTNVKSAMQLSDEWIRGNLPKSGLSSAEQKEFIKAFEAGKVRRFYAHTTESGTYFYNVDKIPGSSSQVRIGSEITKF